MRAQACTDLLVSACARRMPEHHIHQLDMCAIYSSSRAALFARLRCMPIQLDLCQHSSACGSFKSAGQLNRHSADQPLLTASYTQFYLLGKRTTLGSLCQYSYMHASTTILLVSACARRMPDNHIHQLGLCALYSSTCAATFARRRCMPIQLDLCQHSSACGTYKRCGQLSPPSADQPLLIAVTPFLS